MTIKDDPLVQATLNRFPGAEIADVRHTPEGEAAAGATPAGYSLAELAKVARDEAWRITASQDALVAAGDRQAAHAGQLEQARKFAAIGRCLDLIRNDKQSVERLRDLARVK